MSAVADPGIVGCSPAISLRQLRRAHERAALAIAAAVSVAALALGPPGAAVQIAVLLAAVVVGLPHGALDHRVARNRFAPGYGRFWFAPFLAGYAALSALMLLAWWLLPSLALLVFLALSVVHFGAVDAGGRSGWPSILAHGGVPIILPALAHPGDVGALFAWLAGNAGAAAVLRFVTGPAALLWGASVLVSVAAAFARSVRAGSVSREKALSWALNGGLAVLFVVLPPLVAFAFYFALVHAPRALMETAEHETAPLPSIGRSLLDAVPLALGALVLGGAVHLMQLPAGWEPATVRTVFWLLAALTVPHMWLAHPLRPARR